MVSDMEPPCTLPEDTVEARLGDSIQPSQTPIGLVAAVPNPAVVVLLGGKALRVAYANVQIIRNTQSFLVCEYVGVNDAVDKSHPLHNRMLGDSAGIGHHHAQRLASVLLRLSIPKLPPGGFDFVLMSRRALDTFNAVDVRNPVFQGDLLWAPPPTAMPPYTRQERTIGRSQYTFWKMIKNCLDSFLDASYLPIRFISGLSMLTPLGGFFRQHRRGPLAIRQYTLYELSAHHHLGNDHQRAQHASVGHRG